MKHVKILHNAVGAFPQGWVTSWTDFKEKHPGADLKRLLDLKAIELTDEAPNPDALPAGPENPATEEPVSDDDLEAALLADDTPAGREEGPGEPGSEEAGTGTTEVESDLPPRTGSRPIKLPKRTKAAS